jgi:hypothetical protein
MGDHPLSEAPPDFEPTEWVVIIGGPLDGKKAEIFGVTTTVTRLGWTQHLLLETGFLDAVVVPSDQVKRISPQEYDSE